MTNPAYLIRGAAPEPLRFIAVAPEPRYHFGAACTAPAVPASESTLGSHPCVALSSAQLLLEWTTPTQPCNDFSLDGYYPLNWLSHSRGSLHPGRPLPMLSANPSRLRVNMTNTSLARQSFCACSR